VSLIKNLNFLEMYSYTFWTATFLDNRPTQCFIVVNCCLIKYILWLDTHVVYTVQWSNDRHPVDEHVAITNDRRELSSLHFVLSLSQSFHRFIINHSNLARRPYTKCYNAPSTIRFAPPMPRLSAKENELAGTIVLGYERLRNYSFQCFQ